MLARAGTTATVGTAATAIEASSNNIINIKDTSNSSTSGMTTAAGAGQSQGESSRKDNRTVGDACHSEASATKAMPATEGTPETAMMPATTRMPATAAGRNPASVGTLVILVKSQQNYNIDLSHTCTVTSAPKYTYLRIFYCTLYATDFVVRMMFWKY
jgi:hypothetical protein